MSGLAREEDALPPSSKGDWLALLSYLVFLPATAITSVALGILLLLHPQSLVSFYLPISLFAIGIGVLASSTSLRKRKNRAPSSEVPATPLPEAPAAPTLPPPSLAAASAERRTPRAWGAKGSEWRVLSDPDHSGLGSGLAWLARRGGWRAHAAGREAAPGVVRSPGNAGNLVALPMRHYYPGVRSPLPPEEFADLVDSLRDLPIVEPPPARTVPPAARYDSIPPSPPPSRTERTFSEEELDRLFPRGRDRRAVFLSDAPTKVGGAPLLASSTERPGDAREPSSSGDSSQRPEQPQAPPTGRFARPVRSCNGSHSWRGPTK